MDHIHTTHILHWPPATPILRLRISFRLPRTRHDRTNIDIPRLFHIVGPWCMAPHPAQAWPRRFLIPIAYSRSLPCERLLVCPSHCPTYSPLEADFHLHIAAYTLSTPFAAPIHHPSLGILGVGSSPAPAPF